VVVDPSVSPSLLAEFDQKGAVGIRLNLINQPIPDFQNKQWQTLLKNLNLLDWQIEIHREARDFPAGSRILPREKLH
jgi:predicted TIM-barrel fold metal-dependent hydrolase